MATIQATSNKLNPFETIKDRYQKTSAYSALGGDKAWQDAATTQTLDTFAATLMQLNESNQVDALKENYNLDVLNNSEKLLAGALQLGWIDNTELNEYTRYATDEETGEYLYNDDGTHQEETYEDTAYNYYNDYLHSIIEQKEYYEELDAIRAAKDERNGFVKFLAACADFFIGLAADVVDVFQYIGEFITATGAALGEALTGGSAKDAGNAFRNVMSTTTLSDILNGDNAYGQWRRSWVAGYDPVTGQPNTLQQVLGSMAQTAAEMVPSMLIGGIGNVKATRLTDVAKATKIAKVTGKISEITYWTTLGITNVAEYMKNPDYASTPVWSILLSSALEATVDALIAKAFSTLMGSSVTQRFMFGWDTYSKTAATTLSFKTTAGRVGYRLLHDFVEQGITEVFQEWSTYGVRALVGIIEPSMRSDDHFTLQQAMQAYYTAGITALISGGFSILATERVSTNIETTDKQSATVFKKYGKFVSFDIKQSALMMQEAYEMTQNPGKYSAKQQMRAARLMMNAYMVIGETYNMFQLDDSTIKILNQVDQKIKEVAKFEMENTTEVELEALKKVIAKRITVKNKETGEVSEVLMPATEEQFNAAYEQLGIVKATNMLYTAIQASLDAYYASVKTETETKSKRRSRETDKGYKRQKSAAEQKVDEMLLLNYQNKTSETETVANVNTEAAIETETETVTAIPETEEKTKTPKKTKSSKTQTETEIRDEALKAANIMTEESVTENVPAERTYTHELIDETGSRVTVTMNEQEEAEYQQILKEAEAEVSAEIEADLRKGETPDGNIIANPTVDGGLIDQTGVAAAADGMSEELFTVIAEQVDDILNDKTTSNLQRKAAELSKLLDVNSVIVTKDGHGVILRGDDFDSILVVSNDFLEAENVPYIIRAAFEETIITKCSEQWWLSGAFKNLTDLYVSYHHVKEAWKVDAKEVTAALFFDPAFFEIALYSGNKDVFDLLMRLDDIYKVLQKPNDQTNHVAQSILDKRIQSLKSELKQQIANYVRYNPNYVSLDTIPNDLLPEKDKTELRKAETFRELENAVVKFGGKPENYINASDPTIKGKQAYQTVVIDAVTQLIKAPGVFTQQEQNALLSKLTAVEQWARQDCMSQIRTRYPRLFNAEYDDRTYLNPNGVGNIRFNQWLQKNGWTLNDLANIRPEMFASDQLAEIQNRGGTFKVQALQWMTQNFATENANKFKFTYTDGKVKVTVTTPRPTGTNAYDIDAVWTRNANVGDAKLSKNDKFVTGHASYKTCHVYTQQLTKTTADPITKTMVDGDIDRLAHNPQALRDKIYAETGDDYYKILNYINNFVNEESHGTQSVVFDQNGRAVIANYTNVLNVLMPDDPNSKTKSWTKIDKILADTKNFEWTDINGTQMHGKWVMATDLIQNEYLDLIPGGRAIRVFVTDTLELAGEETSFGWYPDDGIIIMPQIFPDCNHCTLAHEFEHAIETTNKLLKGADSDFFHYYAFSDKDLAAVEKDIKSIYGEKVYTAMYNDNALSYYMDALKAQNPEELAALQRKSYDKKIEATLKYLETADNQAKEYIRKETFCDIVYNNSGEMAANFGPNDIAYQHFVIVNDGIYEGNSATFVTFSNGHQYVGYDARDGKHVGVQKYNLKTIDGGYVQVTPEFAEAFEKEAERIDRLLTPQKERPRSTEEQSRIDQVDHILFRGYNWYRNVPALLRYYEAAMGTDSEEGKEAKRQAAKILEQPVSKVLQPSTIEYLEWTKWKDEPLGKVSLRVLCAQLTGHLDDEYFNNWYENGWTIWGRIQDNTRIYPSPLMSAVGGIKVDQVLTDLMRNNRQTLRYVTNFFGGAIQNKDILCYLCNTEQEILFSTEGMKNADMKHFNITFRNTKMTTLTTNVSQRNRLGYKADITVIPDDMLPFNPPKRVTLNGGRQVDFEMFMKYGCITEISNVPRNSYTPIYALDTYKEGILDLENDAVLVKDPSTDKWQILTISQALRTPATRHEPNQKYTGPEYVYALDNEQNPDSDWGDINCYYAYDNVTGQYITNMHINKNYDSGNYELAVIDNDTGVAHAIENLEFGPLVDLTMNQYSMNNLPDEVKQGLQRRQEQQALDAEARRTGQYFTDGPLGTQTAVLTNTQTPVADITDEDAKAIEKIINDDNLQKLLNKFPKARPQKYNSHKISKDMPQNVKGTTRNIYEYGGDEEYRVQLELIDDLKVVAQLSTSEANDYVMHHPESMIDLLDQLYTDKIISDKKYNELMAKQKVAAEVVTVRDLIFKNDKDFAAELTDSEVDEKEQQLLDKIKNFDYGEFNEETHKLLKTLQQPIEDDTLTSHVSYKSAAEWIGITEDQLTPTMKLIINVNNQYNDYMHYLNSIKEFIPYYSGPMGKRTKQSQYNKKRLAKRLYNDQKAYYASQFLLTTHRFGLAWPMFMTIEEASESLVPIFRIHHIDNPELLRDDPLVSFTLLFDRYDALENVTEYFNNNIGIDLPGVYGFSGTVKQKYCFMGPGHTWEVFCDPNVVGDSLRVSYFTPRGATGVRTFPEDFRQGGIGDNSVAWQTTQYFRQVEDSDIPAAADLHMISPTPVGVSRRLIPDFANQMSVTRFNLLGGAVLASKYAGSEIFQTISKRWSVKKRHNNQSDIVVYRSGIFDFTSAMMIPLHLETGFKVRDDVIKLGTALGASHRRSSDTLFVIDETDVAPSASSFYDIDDLQATVFDNGQVIDVLQNLTVEITSYLPLHASNYDDSSYGPTVRDKKTNHRYGLNEVQFGLKNSNQEYQAAENPIPEATTVDDTEGNTTQTNVDYVYHLDAMINVGAYIVRGQFADGREIILGLNEVNDLILGRYNSDADDTFILYIGDVDTHDNHVPVELIRRLEHIQDNADTRNFNNDAHVACFDVDDNIFLDAAVELKNITLMSVDSGEVIKLDLNIFKDAVDALGQYTNEVEIHQGSTDNIIDKAAKTFGFRTKMNVFDPLLYSSEKEYLQAISKDFAENITSYLPEAKDIDPFEDSEGWNQHPADLSAYKLSFPNPFSDEHEWVTIDPEELTYADMFSDQMKFYLTVKTRTPSHDTLRKLVNQQAANNASMTLFEELEDSEIDKYLVETFEFDTELAMFISKKTGQVFLSPKAMASVQQQWLKDNDMVIVTPDKTSTEPDSFAPTRGYFIQNGDFVVTYDTDNFGVLDETQSFAIVPRDFVRNGYQPPSFFAARKTPSKEQEALNAYVEGLRTGEIDNPVPSDLGFPRTIYNRIVDVSNKSKPQTFARKSVKGSEKSTAPKPEPGSETDWYDQTVINDKTGQELVTAKDRFLSQDFMKGTNFDAKVSAKGSKNPKFKGYIEKGKMVRVDGRVQALILSSDLEKMNVEFANMIREGKVRTVWQIYDYMGIATNKNMNQYVFDKINTYFFDNIAIKSVSQLNGLSDNMPTAWAAGQLLDDMKKDVKRWLNSTDPETVKKGRQVEKFIELTENSWTKRKTPWTAKSLYNLVTQITDEMGPKYKKKFEEDYGTFFKGIKGDFLKELDEFMSDANNKVTLMQYYDGTINSLVQCANLIRWLAIRASGLTGEKYKVRGVDNHEGYDDEGVVIDTEFSMDSINAQQMFNDMINKESLASEAALVTDYLFQRNVDRGLYRDLSDYELRRAYYDLKIDTENRASKTNQEFMDQYVEARAYQRKGKLSKDLFYNIKFGRTYQVEKERPNSSIVKHIQGMMSPTGKHNIYALTNIASAKQLATKYASIFQLDPKDKSKVILRKEATSASFVDKNGNTRMYSKTDYRKRLLALERTMEGITEYLELGMFNNASNAKKAVTAIEARGQLRTEKELNAALGKENYKLKKELQKYQGVADDGTPYNVNVYSDRQMPESLQKILGLGFKSEVFKKREVQNLTEENEKNIQMSMDKFFAEILPEFVNFTDADTTEIINFLCDANVVIDSDDINALRRYQAYKMFLLTYYMEEEEKGNIILDNDTDLKMRTAMKAMVSSGATVMAIWRRVVHRLNPTQKMAAQLYQRYGLEYDELELGALVDALNTNPSHGYDSTSEDDSYTQNDIKFTKVNGLKDEEIYNRVRAYKVMGIFESRYDENTKSNVTAKDGPYLKAMNGVKVRFSKDKVYWSEPMDYNDWAKIYDKEDYDKIQEWQEAQTWTAGQDPSAGLWDRDIYKGHYYLPIRERGTDGTLHYKRTENDKIMIREVERPRVMNINTYFTIDMANKGILVGNIAELISDSILRSSKENPNSVIERLVSWEGVCMLCWPATWARNKISNYLVRWSSRLADQIGKVVGINGLFKGQFKEYEEYVDDYNETQRALTAEGKKAYREIFPYKIVGTTPTDAMVSAVDGWMKYPMYVDKDGNNVTLMDAIGSELNKFVDKTGPSITRAQRKKKMVGLGEETPRRTPGKDIEKENPGYSLAAQQTQMIVESLTNKLLNKRKFSGKGDNAVAEAIGNGANAFCAFVFRFLSDRADMQKDFKYYFSRVLTERGIRPEEVNPNDTEIMTIAADVYSYVAWKYMHRGSVLSKLENEIKKKGTGLWAVYKQFFYFGNATWNWFLNMLKLTPVGLGQAIYKICHMEQESEKAQERYEQRQGPGPDWVEYDVKQDFGKGVLGTVLFGLGCLLGAFGVIAIDDEDNKLKIRFGDNFYIDISAVYGTSSFLAGAALTYSIFCADSGTSRADALVTAIDSMFSCLLDDSIITTFYNSFRYATSAGNWLTSEVTSILAMMVPNVMKKVSSLLYTFNPQYSNNEWAKAWEKLFVQCIPGAAYAFPREIDVFTGEVKSTYHAAFWTKLWNSLSPIDVYPYKRSEAEQEARRLGLSKSQLSGNYEDIGKLTKKQVQALNQMYGQLNYDALTKFMNNKTTYKVQAEDGSYVELKYSQMTDEQRANVFSRIMSENSTYSKIYVYTDFMGGKYYATEEMYQTLKALGIKSRVYKETGKKSGFM